MKSKTHSKRTFIRIGLFIALVGFGFFLYNIGMEHQVLLDNKTVTVDGKSMEEIPYARLTIDNNTEEPIEFEVGDRDITKLVGRSHKLKLEILEEDLETVTKTVERDLPLGTTPSVMISLPAILAEAENITIPLPTEAENEKAAEDASAAEDAAEKAQEASEVPSTNP